MPSFNDSRPSAKVRLRIVLEEFANPFKNTPSKTPQKPSTLLKGVKDDRDTLTYVPDPDAPAGTTRFLLVDKNLAHTGGSFQQKTDSKGLTHEIPGIMPVEATWKQAGIRAADTASIKIKWIDFPIDPRVVRACAVELYIGAVQAEDYSRGIGGEMRLDQAGNSSGEPMNVVPDTYFDDKGKQRSNLRFQGWVDEWDLDLSENGEPLVVMQCRDNTQLLIKQEAPAKLVASAVNDDVAIDEAIAGYLQHFPQMEGLSVEYRPTTTDRADVPRLKKVLAKTAYVPQLGPQQSKGGGAGEKMSVWDYLTDVCGSIGHTIRVEGTLIVIQKASTLLRGDAQPRPDDPYVARTTEDGGQFPIRAMIYGRNLSELKMKREYNKKEPSNIEVRCYDPHRKTVLVVRSPKDLGQRIEQHLPGDKSENKWTVLRVSGIRDKEVLQSIADEAFEQLGRGEFTASMKTKELWSWGGNDADPDLLDAKPGDSIEILLNRDTDYATMNNIERSLTLQGENALLLRRLGFDPDFANAVAKAYADSGFQRAFRLRDMQVEFNESGITISLSCQNYITARIEKNPPKDETELDKTPDAPTPNAQTAPGGKRVPPNQAFLDQIAAENAKLDGGT